jgi:hypothetical protein
MESRDNLIVMYPYGHTIFDALKLFICLTWGHTLSPRIVLFSVRRKRMLHNVFSVCKTMVKSIASEPNVVCEGRKIKKESIWITHCETN